MAVVTISKAPVPAWRCGAATMSTLGALGAFALAAWAAAAPPAPPAPPTLDQFLKIRTPAGATLAPDGTLYVRDWPDGVWQLYRVIPGARGGPGAPLPGWDYSPGKAKFTRLTSFKDGLSGYSLSPDAERIALSHAEGGNENFQVSLLDTATGAIKPALADPIVRHSLNVWLDDHTGFIYTANATDPEDFSVYRFDFASGASTPLVTESGAWGCDDATPDGARLIVNKYTSESDSQVFELDAATGKLTELTLRGTDPTASNNAVGYLPGERQVLITSDHRDGLTRLYVKDLDTGAVTSPIPALDPHEIDGARLSLEKDMLAVVTNEDGFGVPHVYAIPGFALAGLPPMDRGVVGVGSFRGRQLVWSLTNARSPGESYATAFPQLGASPAFASARQLTHAQTQGIDLSGFPLPELVKFKSFDGVEIPAFVFFPPGYDTKKPRPIPFICQYHGGPEGQHRPTFSAQNQYFLSRGFGIIMPNVRGSTGYGRKFHMMDDYRNRWASVKDGVAAAKLLVDRGWSAPGKIATFGGSYGGFMSVACLVEDAEAAKAAGAKPLFGAGVDIVGVVNFRTFLEKTSGYRRKLREAEYGPLTDSEFLDSVSPLLRAESISVPMLIAHGANDPRVPLNEAIQLAVALMKRGVSVEQVYFPDEGHGFAKLENRLIFGKAAAGFLEKTIGK